MSNHGKVVSYSNGDLRAWVEQGQSVCIKAVTREGDPVELSASELRKLIQSLQEMLAQVQG